MTDLESGTLAALWKALTAGDYARAYQIAGPLAQMVALETNPDSFVAIEKHLLVQQGVLPSQAMRGPRGDELDEPTRHEAERLLELLRTAVEGD